MAQFQDTWAAVRGVAAVAGSLRLINCVGLENAKVVETQALAVCSELEVPGRVMSQIAPIVCQLARDCIHLVDAVNPDLAADMSICFDQPGLIIWGFSLEVAELITFALAGVSSLLTTGKYDMSIPSHRYAKRAEVAVYLEKVGSDIDGISMQIYGGLCRLEVPPSGGSSSANSDESRLLYAFQCICAWSLAMVYHFEGTGHLSSDMLWEWASGDPLWALVLVKGVLLLRPEEIAAAGLPAPDNLQHMKDVVVGASLGLSTHHIAFRDELRAGIIADDLDGGFTMIQRVVGLSLHRSLLAVAVVDSGFVDAFLQETTQSGMVAWVPATASFLANLTKPPQGDAAAWAQVAAEGVSSPQDFCTLTDAHGVAEALAASIHSPTLWNLLLGVPTTHHRTASSGIGGGTGFLLDCATIAYSVPPSQDVCMTFLAEACLAGNTADDLNPTSMAALCALAVNGGLAPGGDLLTCSLDILSPEAKAQTAECLHRCRAPIRHLELLHSWAGLLDAPSVPPAPDPVQDFNHGMDSAAVQAPSAASLRAGQEEAGVETRSSVPSLRDLVHGAPKELRCVLDGKLLMDPVRSPYGHVFERSNLARALAQAPGYCPVTGQSLVLDDCQRVGELRAQASRWIRQVKPMQRVR